MAVRAAVRFKAADIWDTPEDGNRYEVIDGALYVTPPPLWIHQRSGDALFGYLWHHVRQGGLGEVVTAPVGVVLDEGTGVQPDIVFVSRGRLSIVSERGVEGAPDLVVEVLSTRTRTRDRGIKMRRYALAGVPWYWLLDPRSRALEEYGLAGGEFQLVASSGPWSPCPPRVFPGLEIPMDGLWS